MYFKLKMLIDIKLIFFYLTLCLVTLPSILLFVRFVYKEKYWYIYFSLNFKKKITTMFSKYYIKRS